MIGSVETTRTGDRPHASIFGRILVGVDGSAESREAARQAAILLDQHGSLTVLAAWSLPTPGLGAVAPDFPPDDAPLFAQDAAEQAAALAAGDVRSLAVAEEKVVAGVAWDALLKEAAASGATLVAVGSHGIGRLRGIVIGSTATELVHKAPCAVLVARAADGRFPRRVVVGVDGSPGSAEAHAVAQAVAVRFGAELWPVVAHGGEGVDRGLVAAIVDHRYESLPDEPVRALVAASSDADLVVVGSRGLHGLKALGSVSERVAHEARCSALVVRTAGPAA